MAKVKNRFWRRARAGFRWLRIAFLSFVVLLLLLLVALNVWGIPGFITSKVRAQLREQHFNIEIGKIRLAGFHHLLAENLRLSSTTATDVPLVEIPRAEIILDTAALRHFQLQVRGVQIQKGRVDIPAGSELAPDRVLSVTNIQTQLEFLPEDVWQVSGFQAELRGVRATGSAYLTNISKLKLSSQFPSKTGPSQWQREVAEILNSIQEIHFETQPVISLDLSGDATRPATFWVNLRAESRQVRTPWGSIDHFELVSGIRPQTNSVLGLFSLYIHGVKIGRISVENLTSEGSSIWNSDMEQLLTNHWTLAATNFNGPQLRTAFLDAHISSSQSSPTNQIVSKLLAHSAPFEIFGARTGSNFLEAELSHPLPFSSPAILLRDIFPGTNHLALSTNQPRNSISGKWRVQTPRFDTSKVIAEDLSLLGEIETVSTNAIDTTELGFWRYWTPYRIPWRLAMSNIYAENVNIGSLNSEGLWESPHLVVSSLNTQLYGGSLVANSRLNIYSREVIGDAQANFDYHKGALLLEKQVQNWLAQFSWKQPPEVGCSFRFLFPHWNEEWNTLDKQLGRSLELAGFLKGEGAFREIPLGKIQSHFTFTNLLWSLPDLVITRPEGLASIAYTGNVNNSTFKAAIDSKIDPAAFKPLLPEDQQALFDFVFFDDPPIIRGTALGNWEHTESLGFQGEINTTNFYLRGVPYSDLAMQVSFTNSIVEARNAIAHRGAEEEVRAPYLRVDIPREVMFVTNVTSTTDPWLAMSLVGEEVYRAIAPYRFETPPSVRLHGNVPLRHWSKADLHFEVAGTNFTYWKFHLPNLVGDVYWKADHISFSNVFAGFYGGVGQWSGHFYINDQHSADFSFLAHVTDADLKSLMNDLAPSTNHLEGRLNGRLVVTSANSDDLKSWNGFGEGNVKNGYLWSVPVLGIFSPVLDAITPGAGLSRITAAEGSYSITNSVIETRDMQVRAPAFRLNYKGKVDFDGKIDARVDAEILRDAWLVGRLFSAVLWPVSKAFEAKITGTLNDPKTKLRYFPKFLFAPLKTLGALAEPPGKRQQPENPQTGTPAIPKNPE